MAAQVGVTVLMHSLQFAIGLSWMARKPDFVRYTNTPRLHG